MNTMSGQRATVSAVKLALLAKQARAQAAHVLRSDPIAVVGMSCRVAGGVTNADGMWRLLRDGAQTAREVPADRWDVRDWCDPNPAAPGKSLTREGSFLDRIDGFDSEHFGILPREADRMDPQQRLTLEVAIDALDDAGQPQEKLRGSRTAVYFASIHNDYAQLQYADPDSIDARTLTGTLHSVLANRLSYLLDLRGPSLSIDSACSSSLVAIHLACESLRSGETDLAIAGGVSLMMTPELTVAMSKVGFMAPDGRCKTFDASADGFARGEGCGIVVLKRLSDAIADDDRIHGVIRGSAVNQDGRSTVLSAPNGLAQEALIHDSLRASKLDAGRICYFEAHGTGTALGDPIEVEAIAATVGRSDESETTCWLGSAKANFGHLEAAAGVIGLIKTILVLRHGAAPPQPLFRTLNPHITLKGTRLAIPTALTPLPDALLPRCAAVSSFGIGGTNANVIVEEAPRMPAPRAQASGMRLILPLSAQSPAALSALVKSWIPFLADTQAPLDDLVYTAARRRTHYRCRVAVSGVSKEELRARLEAVAANAPFGPDRSRPPRVGFVFCGQGPQWFAMGRELLEAEPRFRDTVTECDALLRPLAGWSLLHELSLPEERSRLAETEIAQPALFAVQVGLAALWVSWGVSPDCVAGHSLGEIAALHMSGAIDLSEAVRIVFHRGRVMQRATGGGRMAAVGLSEAEAAAVVAPYGARVGVGAVNGPRSVVLSGEAAALEEVLAIFNRRGVSCRMLPVNYAFHSAQMAPLQAEFLTALGRVKASEPRVPFVSTVTGARLTGGPDAAYFARGVRDPVRFAAAAREMLQDCGILIEIGPHPVLGAALADCTDPSGSTPLILASLRHGRPERETMLEACAGVYAAGREIDWKEVQPGSGRVVDLPSYPWQRRRHWLPVRNARTAKAPWGEHPLLGPRTEVVGVEASLYQADSSSAPAWLADHRIGGRVLMPAAAEMEAFWTAATRLLATSVEIVDFAIEWPLAMPEEGEASISWQVIARKTEGGAELAWHASQTASASGSANWRCIATARARPAGDAPSPPPDPATTATAPFEAVGAEFAERGAEFGPSFRCLRQAERADGFARAMIELVGEEPVDSYALHPGLIDAALQLCLVAAGGKDADAIPDALYLPVGADRVLLNPSVGREFVARARIRDAAGASGLVADIWVEAPSGRWAMVIEGMRLARAERIQRSRARSDEHLYRVEWTPIPGLPSQARHAAGTWLLLADEGDIANGVAEKLRKAGARVVVARRGNGYRRIAEDDFVVDSTESGAMRRMFQDVGFDRDHRLRGAIDCWPLDIPKGEHRLAEGEPFFDALGTGAALHLVQAINSASALESGALILATRGAAAVDEAGMSGDLCPRGAGLWGLAAAIASEFSDFRVRMVDLDPERAPDDADALYAECVQASDARVAYRDRRRWAPRLRRYTDSESGSGDRPSGVVVGRIGVLDGVELMPRSREPLRDGQVRLKVLAAGLNFRDVLIALGLYSGPHAPIGAECAGVIVETGAKDAPFQVGDLVFGCVPDCLATEAVAEANTLALVPPGMPATMAASLPIAFLTALYGLERVAGLAKGQSVLIHAAAGGVGQAAVRIAQRAGAEIFATAGSDEKRRLLARQGVDHVLNSRSLDFADQILALTKGRGVDVVLNSLAGDFIAASLRSLAKGGCFLELGKRDVWSTEAVAERRPDVRYAVYDLGDELKMQPSLFHDMMADLAVMWSESGSNLPPVTLFPLERPRDAMRLMAQGRHVGKIVLVTKAGRAAPAPAVAGDGTYWITGGLGALGKETARWLARRGARHLVLSGRHADDAAAADIVQELARSGTVCRVVQADASDKARMSEVYDEIQRSGRRLRGLVHAAGVLRDAALINQSDADAAEIRRGKVEGAWILHDLTRDASLDFFVLYSAAAVVLGAPGQGVYAAANAELDALARFRQSLGLPGLSVAWGAWGGAGMAADLVRRGRDVFASRGLGMIEPDLAFSQLERLLADGAAYGAVIPIDWTRFLLQLPQGADRGFFSGLTSTSTPRPDVAADASSLLERLKGAPSALRLAALSDELAARARHIIGLGDGARLPSTTPLRDLGLDSLMAVEMRNALVRLGGRALPATLLFDYPHLDALTSHLFRAWGLDFDMVVAEAGGTRAAPREADFADLSEAEAEKLLLAELAVGGGGWPR